MKIKSLHKSRTRVCSNDEEPTKVATPDAKYHRRYFICAGKHKYKRSRMGAFTVLKVDDLHDEYRVPRSESDEHGTALIQLQTMHMETATTCRLEGCQWFYGRRDANVVFGSGKAQIFGG